MPNDNDKDKDKNYKSFKSFAELSGPQQGGGGRGPSGPQQSQSGGRGGASSGGRGGGFGPDPLQGYLMGGYFEESGHLRKEIFIDWAKSMTEALAREKTKATKNSLRAFYSMLRMAKNQFDAQKTDREGAWGDAKAQLYRLRTAAQYQGTRGVISRLCQEKFLNDNIDLVLKEGTSLERFTKYFNAFVEHFQAVIAYLPERADR